MPEIFSLNDFTLFVLVVPGFLMVWTFRYFTDSKKDGDFEFLGLGLLCGLFNLLFFGLLINLDILHLPSENSSSGTTYGLALVLCLITFFLGFLCAQISKADWFRAIMRTLKKSWFDIGKFKK